MEFIVLFAIQFLDVVGVLLQENAYMVKTITPIVPLVMPSLLNALFGLVLV